MSVILRVGAVKSVGGQEFLYGSGDEASSSYTDADVLDIPLPEHTYQRPLPPSSTQSLNSLSCFGLPYQDHNYGMPPPPSPPRPVSPRPPSPLQVNGIVEMEEEVKTTPLVSVAEEVVEDSITRCICGYLHDDGYMICCDKCSVWQHIDCMGVDRNNIPESYFCELCQPRTLDATKAKSLQKRKREELAARNVLSDSSATDTDPEEAANALASMGKKLPTTRKKGLKHKRSSKVKDKPPLKLKIGKPLKQKKIKNPGKKEKENIKATKSKKLFKQGQQKIKLGKVKNRPLLTTEQLNADPWNSNLSPWIDAYEHAIENQYSAAVKEFFCSSHMMDVSSVMSEHLLTQLTCVIVAEVKKNRKGLKATQEIPAGQVIIEYKGKVMLRHDYDKEYAFVNSFKKLQPFVLFYSKLDVDICVDARVYGNEARFIRRSCTPNSEVKHIFTQGKLFFVIVSQKDILAGSEITVSFDYNYQECSYCVECACVKNNCIVSRYWKKIKSAHNKSTAKDLSGKRRRQLSGSEVEKHSFYEASNSSTTQASPIQNVSSPIKTLPLKHPVPTNPTTKLSSPVKLSNVSTLLAASALLDEQPDLAKTLKLEVPDLLHQAPPPPAPPPQPHSKSATSSRRGSRVSEDAIKEEKVEVKILVPNKEKSLKVKETKTKDKDGKDHHYHHQELKKERRPSSRRQSQDEIEENLEVKNEVSNLSTIAGNESDDSNAGNECPRKKTREERKLDAIMKAFEKMEKREERRKEALARGETGTKKCHDLKPKKESESNIGNSNNSIHSRSTSQESSFEVEIKVENHVEDHADVKSPEPLIETKEDTPTNLNSNINVSSYFSCATSSAPTTETTKVIKDETSNKPARKPGKRKRRRSRVQSATAISDVASVSTEDGNSNSSFPPSLMSMPSTPVSAPANTSNPIMDTDGGIFKFIKTKKHLFEEWSNKQEDESTKHGQEMFVQCLPNPHVNTMDHLQRRNSSSSGCNSKSSECSAGSAKKRWLRQAMHEVPVPIAFHPSLSVNTDNGGTSPVHGGSSPNPGTGLGSPGSASPLDFVTPLKKRRLMRESMSVENNDGPLPFPSAGVLSENFSSNSIGFTTKTNGVKQIFPAHRHSVDDRLLHKGYSLHNGIREAGAQSDGKISTATNSRFSLTTQHTEQNDLDTRNRLLDQRTTESMPVSLREALPVSVPLPWVNGLSESAVTAPFTQQPSQFSLNFRGIYERMEVDSSEIINKEIVLKPIASSSRIDENGLHLLKSSYNTIEEVSRIDSSASTSAVVVVNSSTVYKSVNNLIDEGSEAGCVTAKTIMDEDSPATVRIDLNAHEMEPSSLTDGTRAVSLTDRYFGNSRQNMLSFSTCNECQVNSSEDVVDTLPLVTPDHNSDICDNVCTDSSSVQICGLRELDSQRTFNESLLKLEEIETVDSSQHVNRDQNHELPTVFEETDSLIVSRAVDVQPTASSTRRDVEYISSSGQATSQHIIVCDSLEETEQHNVESGTVSHHCDSNNVQIDDERTEEEDASENEGMQTCDSMGINQASGHPFIRSTDETEEESGDTAVTESQSIDTHSFFSVSLDNNVDSTSSETNRSFHRSSFPNDNKETECGETMLTDNGCCDSNYERQPNDPSVLESLTAGDESLEGLGVSSSNGVDSQANNSSWDSYRRKDLQTEVYNDSAVSTENLECNSRISQSTPVVHNSSEVPAIQDQSDTSSETGLSSSFFARSGQVSASNCTVASSNLAPHSFTMSPPSSSLLSSSPSSSMFSVECALSSTSPSTSSVQPSTLTSSDVSSFSCSPPISSTGEATPSVKKKVSLLEYRKRLKEKPACCITETRTSETSTSSSSVIIHHKLSSTLSEFLSASPSASSSESPTKPIFQSSSHKQQFMPTLETLPLFKLDHNKDELKKKQKTEKPLSLTERLRLEFGLEDCGDDLNKKVKGDESEVASSNDSVDDGAPPPPPPPTPSLNFTSATVGFNVTPLRGFHAQPAPLVNGGSGYNFQQQSNITSTSLTVQSSEISHGSRERETSFYAGQNGSSLTSILHSYPQQAPPSSTSHSNLQYPHTRTANLGSLSSVTASLLQSSTNHISFDFSQRQSQTVVSGNILPEDHPPPPPPPPRPHHRPSSAASTSHRQNHLQSSNGKSSKAASSSSSSTHYPDNRSRY